MVEKFSEELDNECLNMFPEMLLEFTKEDLAEASNIGRYIFFEDYFNAFIEVHKDNDPMLARAAKFIEILAQSENEDVQHLTEIGILEGLVSRQTDGIAKYLKPYSKKLLNQATSRTKIDRSIWLLDRNHSR